MVTRLSSRAARSIGALATLITCGAHPVVAAPVLRGAEARVTLTSPTTCEVDLSLTIEGATSPIEHRLEVLDGAEVTPAEVDGAETIGESRDIGRTRALTLRPTASTYRIRYRVRQPSTGGFRCPIWLPTTPADGRSRTVRITATLPTGAAPAGTMPSFAWAEGAGTPGPVGTVTLGHLPAFVRLPYAGAGATPPWNLARLMDGAALGVLALASLLWLRRSRGGA